MKYQSFNNVDIGLNICKYTMDNNEMRVGEGTLTEEVADL